MEQGHPPKARSISPHTHPPLELAVLSQELPSHPNLSVLSPVHSQVLIFVYTGRFR